MSFHAEPLRMRTNVVYISELCEDCTVANEINYETDYAWTSIHDNGQGVTACTCNVLLQQRITLYHDLSRGMWGSMDWACVYGTEGPWFDSGRAAIWQQNWSQRCVWPRASPSVSRCRLVQLKTLRPSDRTLKERHIICTLKDPSHSIAKNRAKRGVVVHLHSHHHQGPMEEQYSESVSGQLPTRTIPHRVDIGPDEWFYDLILVWWGIVLVGSSPRDCGPGGQ